MKYLKKNDVIITVVILTLDILLLLLFFMNIYASLSYNATDRLGTLIFKKRSATRKHVDALSWNMLQNNTPVYELDTIRTASQSEASILFDDGSSLDLLENSLIKLKMKSSNDFGDVVRGSFVVNSKGEKKTLTIQGKVITMDKDAEIVIHKKDGGENEIEVTKGEIEIVQEDGETLQVQEFQTLTIPQEDSNEKIEVKNISCIPLAPQHNEHLFTSEDRYSITFSWSFFNDGENSQENSSSVVIAKDKDFKNVISKMKGKLVSTEGGNHIWQASYISDLGNLYWRVEYDVDSYSSVRRFSLEKISQIEQMRPKNENVFYYYDDPPNIVFSWNAGEVIPSSTLEISETADFSNPKISIQVVPTSIELSNLTEGVYYWRVVPNIKKHILGKLPEPEVRTFRIIQKEVLYATRLKFPSEGYLCNVNVFPTTGLYFSWEERHEAESYELLFYKNKNDEDAIETIKTSSPYIKLTKDNTTSFHEAGALYFAVRYKSRRGNFSNISEKRVIEKVDYDIDLKSVYPPNNYQVSVDLIINQRFSWKHSLPLKAFFVVAKDKDFKDIIFEKQTSISSFVGLNLKPDTYYWQVRMYNADKSIFAMSEIRGFSVVYPLDIPPLIAPHNNSRVPVLEDEDIKLRWQGVHNADYYEVAVFNSKGRRISFFPIVKNNQISIPVSKYGNDTYEVQLQAFRLDSNVSTRNIGYRGSSSFTTHVLSTVRLGQPNQNGIIDGMKAYTEGVKFSYNASEKYDRLSLVLKKNGSNISPNASYDRVKHIIEVPSLTEGSYEWTVSAFIDGFDVSSKEKRKLTILPIAPLSAPKLLTRKMKETLDVSYLKQNRAIHFEWQAVEEADYYIVRIENESTGEIVSSVSNIKDNFYDFTSFEKLKRGKFVFKVKAASLLSKGNGIRGGYESVYPFEIELPKLENFLVAPEQYYGY
ncbi:MAG: FecR domain-containing protein [Treponema sp.]